MSEVSSSPLASYAGMDTYQQYGFNTDVSTYNPSSFDMTTSQFDSGYRRYLSTNHLSDNAKHWAEYIENYKQLYQSYSNWYTTQYNNEANSTARQIAAGYNPNFQGGSAGSPAQENKGALSYNTNAGVDASVAEANSINGIVQSSLGTLMSIGSAIAGINKTDAEADLIRQSTPSRIDLLREQGFSQWFDNNRNAIDLFGNKDSAFPDMAGKGIYLKSGAEDDSRGLSNFQYQNMEKKAAGEIKEILKQKYKFFKESGEWDATLDLLKAKSTLENYDATIVDKLDQYIDSEIVPSLLKGYKLDNAELQQSLDWIKPDKERGVAMQYFDSAISLLQIILGGYNAKSGRISATRPRGR